MFFATISLKTSELQCFLLLIAKQLETDHQASSVPNHVSTDFRRHTHYVAFDHKASWYTMSTLLEVCLMELNIECAMVMQTSHGLSSCFLCHTPSGLKYSQHSQKIFNGEFQNWKKLHRPFLYRKLYFPCFH